ncbi:MAG TPA: M48 family metalloprotease [Candidatus Omnitrophota bacterium]|nr:M48 family metalloprotease [Candidatus Omnitrophota bacterium]HQJ15609.1 M48 family metalloprotease [Candidatus Omnitrophota bacterium]
MNIYEQIAHNRRMTWLVVSLFVIFFLFIGAMFDMLYTGIPFFSVIALLTAGFSSFMSYRYGDKMVLASCGAHPLDLDDPAQRQWQNVVEEMSIAAGLPVPATFIIDEEDPNAFATGRGPGHSSIAVTRGLLARLNREEQQAVAGHEMSHIMNYDIRLMLIISSLVGAVALISDWANRSLFRSRRRSSSGSDSSYSIIILAIWLITAVLAPFVSRVLAMLVSRAREYLADASGARITRNPLALASALEKIEMAVKPTTSGNHGHAHLWIVDPRGSNMGMRQGRVADLFATHPPIELRIAALKKMAYEPSG